MRPIEIHPNAEQLKYSVDQQKRLESWLQQGMLDAQSARSQMDSQWQELLRMYDQLPKYPHRDKPIVDGPNIEVPLGADAVDRLYSQVLDIVFAASPLISVRAVQSAYTEDAKSMQNFVNWLASDQLKLRDVAEEGFLDNIQLGTGIGYVPWVERTKKTKIRTILNRGPVARTIAPENFLVPGGAPSDTEEAMWIALRLGPYLTEEELKERGTQLKWKWKLARPCGGKNVITNRREQLSRTHDMDVIKSKLYDIWDVYCTYDIDEDGVPEDLLVTYDLTSFKALKIQYNPYDRRPVRVSRYQRRPHLFWGIGALAMLMSYEEGATEVFNHWLINLILANTRIFAAREGSVPEVMDIYPFKVIPVASTDDIKEMKISDTYQSAPMALSTVISMGQQRVGVNEIGQQGASQLLGSRTPGITALSALQQVNRRFTPAFDGMRMWLADIVKEGVFRYQERILAGDTQVMELVIRVLGEKDGASVVNRLRDPDFDDAFTLELTAASASVNRDADRQNAIMLMNLLKEYYGLVMQLGTFASNPALPEPLRELAGQVAKAMAEAVDRTIRTFEQIRDPETFIIDMATVLDQLGQQAQVQQLMAQLQPQAGQPQPSQPQQPGGGEPQPGPEGVM